MLYKKIVYHYRLKIKSESPIILIAVFNLKIATQMTPTRTDIYPIFQ